MGRTELGVVLGEAAAQSQGDQDSAAGVVFMGQRGTKQGHKAITEKLIDRALIAVHLVQRQGKNLAGDGR